jgi:hypothetical protein
MRFDGNKRGLFHVIRSQSYSDAPQTTQERLETIYAVLAVGSILVASALFLVLYWLSE